MLRLPFDEIKSVLARVLRARGCPADRAEKVAVEMARNDLEGTYSHGVNRFVRLVRNIDDGLIDVNASPVPIAAFGAIENYDGGGGLGIPNAWFAMDRAITLAKEHGIGLVALRNTNHWLRAATYGYQACDAGMAGICFTNTIANMPTWGGVDARLGNNPLVLAFPRAKGHIAVDMAMSQFSYGALEMAQMQRRQMPVDAGFDEAGRLTRDPAQVIATRRILPTGYWKGAALSFLLDVFASGISLGNSVAMGSRLSGDEHALCQVMIAINVRAIAPEIDSTAILEDNIDFLLHSIPADPQKPIVYPGQKAQRTRAENTEKGIPVDEVVWRRILALA